MGFWRNLFGLPDITKLDITTYEDSEPVYLEADPAQFAFSTYQPIDQMFREMYAGSPTKVSRAEALSVAGVKRGRDLICSISTLPLIMVDPKNNEADWVLGRQFDPDVPNVVHLAMTVEDLLFEGVAYWLITAIGFDGFPSYVRRVPPSSVSLTPPNTRTPSPLPSMLDPRGAVIWIDGKPVPTSSVIRFDSPNTAILHDGARSIRRAILLDNLAKVIAQSPQPTDYFQPTENAVEFSEEKVREFLAKWDSSRRNRSTGWVPRDIAYTSVSSPSPRDLQLVELQKQVAVEIANLFGLDSEDLNVSTTSRTYANANDRRHDHINTVLAPYMRAITDRLGMDDVTKRGYRVLFDLDDYLKPNPTERWAIYQIAIAAKVMSPEEVRLKEGLPPGAPKPKEPEPTTNTTRTYSK